MHELTTLSEVSEKLKKDGYTLDFNIRENCLYCPQNEGEYAPEAFTVDEVYRFEGMSNPDDMSILFAISTNDGEKGQLVDGYGVSSDPINQEMIQKLHRDPKMSA